MINKKIGTLAGMFIIGFLTAIVALFLWTMIELDHNRKSYEESLNILSTLMQDRCDLETKEIISQ